MDDLPALLNPALADDVASAPAEPTAATQPRGVRYRWLARDGVTPLESLPTDGPLIERIVRARGLEPDARLLDPKLTHLHDPSLIPDLDRAAARILAAAKAREPIVIYGDYDVDGVTSTAILYHMLLALEPDCSVSSYVPHRVDEGYGLHDDAITMLAAQGAKVIVSVDCGVTAIGPALVAKAAGIDLIITDHHNPPASLAELPEAYAVVHPRRPDSKYPFGDLSGAGVAYKLAWRMATLHAGNARVAKPIQELLVNLLGFAALGAIADVVPLLDENRVIARFGMARLRNSPFAGVRALVEAARLDGEKVSEWDIAFKLAPRLNASGRMAHAQAAIELFTTATRARANEIAQDLERHNTERRAVQKRIVEQALEMAKARGMDKDTHRAIVLSHPDWHTGVVGIACSRLVEELSRPTILMCDKDGHCHGSGRSISGVSLHAAMVACSHHLTKFGGHDMAAGLALETVNLAAFTAEFVAECNRRVSVDQLTPRACVDAVTTLGELSPRQVMELDVLKPFGAGNPTVRVLVRDVLLFGSPQPLGKTGEHIVLMVKDTATGTVRRVLAWGWAARLEHLRAGLRYDLVIEPKITTFNGTTNVEPELVDLRQR